MSSSNCGGISRRVASRASLWRYDRDDAIKATSLPLREAVMSYVRASITGSSPGGEVWSINPVFDPTAEFGSTVNQDALDNAANAIAALTPAAALLQSLSTSLFITGARAEVRDDSTDALLGISVQVRPAPLVGLLVPARGSSSAIVVSLRTPTAGGHGRGRLYWPCVGTTVGSDLRLSPSTVTGLVTGFGLYLHAMEDALAA